MGKYIFPCILAQNLILYYPMLPSSLCFLDLETTGTSPVYGRIIDIGIIRVDNGKITKVYEKLVNPERGLDPFISQMTGIRAEHLAEAPNFESIKEEVLELLADSVLVAHNVRFDYGFLRQEFKRFDISFTSKHFCSVKLARHLYPSLKRHNLDAIIDQFGIICKRRHRAYDDAKVIWDFYQIAKNSTDPDIFEKAVNMALRKPSVPMHISENDLDKLPESPGVYIFYGKDESPLYIGKSINIKDRVLSHFSNDYLSATDLHISQEIESIKTIPTAGELGALLLESTLVKKYQPLYNRMLRYARKMIIITRAQDKNGYFTAQVKEVESIDIADAEKLIGVFKSMKQMQEHLYLLAKNFKLCTKLLGLDKVRKRCFYYDLGMCYGACLQKELNIKYNVRFEEAFYKYKIKQWKFEGPILIKEVGDSEEAFVVDKWCLMGSAKSTDEFENLSKEYLFDLDTYKILTKFILSPTRNLSITAL